jgi:hypothetical protein
MIEFLNTLKVNGDEDAFMGPVHKIKYNITECKVYWTTSIKTVIQ